MLSSQAVRSCNRSQISESRARARGSSNKPTTETRFNPSPNSRSSFHKSRTKRPHQIHLFSLCDSPPELLSMADAPLDTAATATATPATSTEAATDHRRREREKHQQQQPRDREREREKDKDLRERDSREKQRSSEEGPPLQQQQQQQQQRRRERDRDSRERRDDRMDDVPPPPARRRDHKRRHSPSPPPYPRRYTPPPFSRRGSSPAAHKRSRRDDRGSPRYGYEGMGGYDRFGRGYVDDRSHSRGHMVRQSTGWPSSGRGFGESGSPEREGLVTYKQFISRLEDDVSPAEAERRYEEYRTQYITTQKQKFFEANKDEEWLRDKYDPSHLEGVIQRRNENAKAVAKEFLADLHNDVLDIGPSATANHASAKAAQSSDHNSDDDVDVNGKRRRHGRGPAKENDSVSNAPKAPTVSSDPRRIKKDIEITRALIRKLDAEKGIEENILGGSEEENDGDKSLGGSMGLVIVRGANTVKGLEDVELLDVTVTYLWRVHGLDYYGMVELKEPPKGLRHVRVESKSSYDEQLAAAAEWEKKLESTWQGRLQGQDPLVIMAAKDKLDAATTEALDPYVRKIRDEKYGWKYGCGAKSCSKLFHAAEYVHKHLRLKHPDLITELTAKVREELYFQNYMNDSDAPGVNLVTQPSGQRDKSRRRRDRGRDGDYYERASRRDTDRMDRRSYDDDRYDRDDDSPTRDHPDVRHDSPIFDAFPGPAMHGPPFGSDMPPPPPVLMPVPGAGPLGPFVPAPPDVTMRMLREGNAPFHPNEGGPRGRKGRPSGGHHMGGMMEPPVILPMVPSFHQDPRRIRSYHDLDAPEDEVTAIDYRSL